jgi:hypothetical protein
VPRQETWKPTLREAVNAVKAALTLANRIRWRTESGRLAERRLEPASVPAFVWRRRFLREIDSSEPTRPVKGLFRCVRVTRPESPPGSQPRTLTRFYVFRRIPT